MRQHAPTQEYFVEIVPFVDQFTKFGTSLWFLINNWLTLSLIRYSKFGAMAIFCVLK